jgi:anti-anti-sigma factor
VQIDETRHGAVTVLKPVGPLTGEGAELFRARVRETMTTSLGRFVIDASAVPLADSRGLEALADSADDLAATGLGLRLCSPTETLRETLELTELSGLFEYYQDVQTAVRSFL